MYLIDTNVVSELGKKRPDRGVLTWFATQPGIVLSAITVDELTYGIERIPPGQAARLRNWFSGLMALPPLVLPVDAGVAQVAGRMRAACENAGKVVHQCDMLIAATALLSQRVLVTRNVKDFQDCGVALLNPFSPQAPRVGE